MPVDIRLNPESLEFNAGSSRFYWFFREINVQLIHKDKWKSFLLITLKLHEKNSCLIKKKIYLWKAYYKDFNPKLLKTSQPQQKLSVFWRGLAVTMDIGANARSVRFSGDSIGTIPYAHTKQQASV